MEDDDINDGNIRTNTTFAMDNHNKENVKFVKVYNNNDLNPLKNINHTKEINKNGKHVQKNNATLNPKTNIEFEKKWNVKNMNGIREDANNRIRLVCIGYEHQQKREEYHLHHTINSE